MFNKNHSTHTKKRKLTENAKKKMFKNFIRFTKTYVHLVSSSSCLFYICTYLLTLITGVLVICGYISAEWDLYFVLLFLIFIMMLCFIYSIYKLTYLKLKHITINLKISISKINSIYMHKLAIENNLHILIKRLLIYTMFFIIYLIFCQCGIGLYFGQIKLILYLLLLILLIRNIYRDYKIKNENLIFHAIVLIKLICSMVYFFIFNPLDTVKIYNTLEDKPNLNIDYRLEQGWLGEGEVSDIENGSNNSNPEPNNNIPLKDRSYDEQVKAIKDKPIFEQIGLIEEEELDEERHRSRLVELVEHRLIEFMESTEISGDASKRANIESYIHDREGALQTLNDIGMFGGNTAVDILNAKALGGEEGERRVEELTKAGMDYLYGEEETNEDLPNEESEEP